MEQEPQQVWLMDPQGDTTNFCFYWKLEDARTVAERVAAADYVITGRNRDRFWVHADENDYEPETWYLRVVNRKRPWRPRRRGILRLIPRRRPPVQDIPYDIVQVKRYDIWDDARTYREEQLPE